MENFPSLIQLAGLWFRGRIFRDQAAKWDHQYATGRWEKLKIPAEQARFAATAQLIVRHGPPGQVLEIGCGEALLQQQLKPADYQDWVGIDISEVAIQRAQAFTARQVRYHVADMELFDPGDRFDLIVFTESIYYSTDPRRLLARYVRFLKPGGRFIVSIFRTKRSDRVWAGLHTVASRVDAISTTSELGTWDCEVLGPNEAQKNGWAPLPGSPSRHCELAPPGAASLLTRLFHFYSGQSGGSGTSA